MIEIAYKDAADRERWRAALRERAAVARPMRGMEPGIATLVALAWAMYYVATLPMVATPSWTIQLAAFALRAVAAVGWLAVLRSTDRQRRAELAPWPNGRFLFSWGYADAEDGLLRVVPIDELELVVRAPRLGLGRRRLELHTGGWSTTFFVTESELAAVAAALERPDGAALEAAASGYRDLPAASRVVGPTARPHRSRFERELVALGAAAFLGSGAPLAVLVLVAAAGAAAVETNAPDPASAAESLTGPFATDMASCAPKPLLVDTVESYLALGLRSPGLGPARPYTLPMLVRRRARDGIWAECAWRIDGTTGLLDAVDAHWGVEIGGRRRRERRATIASTDVLAVIDRCGRYDRRMSVSPRGLAYASVAIAFATIASDVAELTDPPLSARRAALACARTATATIVASDVATD